MTERLPLFPLGTVPFPGLVLPLHVFEERYRLLVGDLLERPEPRTLGIVGIEPGGGAEVGGGTPRPFEVGCAAEIRSVGRHQDGRFDLVTLCGRRFRTKALDRSRPYLRGEVEFLPEESGGEPGPPARAVRPLFRLYRHRLAAAGARTAEPAALPDDPLRLSYAVAGALVLDTGERQRLLEAENAELRLRAERDLLVRENRLLAVLPTVPAGQFLDDAVCPN